MTATTFPAGLDFALPPELEAHAPPEARGATGRDDVRLMVSVGDRPPVHAQFRDIGDHLRPGDVLVVNTSATINAAIDARVEGLGPMVVHFSADLGADRWVVELRRPVGGTTVPYPGDVTGATAVLAGGATAHLVRRLSTATPVLVGQSFAEVKAGYTGTGEDVVSERLWEADVSSSVPILDHLASHGRPIRYSYVPESWPLAAYQSVFGRHPGSAEMPSASRPFTPEVIVDLVSLGVLFAPILLHTGVSSLERHEAPYPERFAVPAATAELVNAARAAGHRIIAVGTTAVRALETVADPAGQVRPGSGWTDVLITPERGVRAVDGLLTGWHEPEATHLLMLEAVAGRRPLELSYPAAVDAGYRWHEFGDVHLLISGKVER